MEKLGLKSEVVDLKNYEPEDSLSEEVKIVSFSQQLCTYQCKSHVGGVRAGGGDLMPGTIPAVGLLIV